jgi:S-adenosyl-L-methionine hydrolase (adenosine-forming)
MITLTTDFGLKDPYVAEMKGVIYSIKPVARIVDVSHLIDKFNVRMAAFILASAAPYFPKGTVHVAVVDPGVGTARRAIAIETEQAYFIGPDNGALILAAQKQGIKHIYELTNSKYMLPTVSSTFHGRDVFAPAAAHLDKGVRPSVFGAEITDPVTPKFANVEHKDGSIFGEVLHVDGYGNVITNISEAEVSEAKSVKVNLHHVSFQLNCYKTYGESKPQEPLALIGSHGFLELALNQGSFSEKYRVNPGDRIEAVLT